MIRPAVIDDVDGLMRLGNAMRAESHTPWPKLDRERVKTQVKLSVDHPETVMVALSGKPDDLTGMVTAVCGDYAFSYERRAACDLLFIQPDARSAQLAIRLIRHFKAWAEAAGAKTAFMGDTTGVDPDRVGKLFERLEFAHVGGTYRMEIE